MWIRAWTLYYRPEIEGKELQWRHPAEACMVDRQRERERERERQREKERERERERESHINHVKLS